MWLNRTLRPLFFGRVLAITEDVIVRWKTLAVEGQRRRHTFGQPDLFIAAIAALEDLVVVTRDTGEFVAAGVPVSIRGRASCTCTAKRYELDRPRLCTRWRSLFSSVVDNRGSRMPTVRRSKSELLNEE